MYVEIKENKLLSWCKEPYLDYEFVDIDYATFDVAKYEVQDGKLVDISETDEYKSKIAEIDKTTKKSDLQSQIDEIDKKRIRAIAEPQLKDEATEQTWLEFYTEQVQGLRAQIAEL